MSNQYKEIPTENLEIAPENVRKQANLSKEELDGLSHTMSTASVGLIAPIVVREMENGKYGVVAGGRRFLAAKQANWPAMPCIVIPSWTTPTQAQLISLVENIQRRDLTIDERADILKAIIKLYDSNRQEVARKLGYPLKVINDWITAAEVVESVKNKADRKDTSLLALLAKVPKTKQQKVYDIIKNDDLYTQRRIISGVVNDPSQDPEVIANRIRTAAVDTTVNVYIRAELNEALEKAVEEHKPRTSKKSYIADALEMRLKNEGYY